MSDNTLHESQIVLKLQFLSGRYHATQWGRNVNEGMIDWPPSPWRILRAIISSWKVHEGDLDLWRILEKMCAGKVTFYIPNAIQSHTRHYVPVTNQNEKMLDSFIIMDKNDSVYVVWKDVYLENDEREMLDRVLRKIKYIGRAESWCDVSLTKDVILPNCIPLQDAHDTTNKTLIDVIVPTPDARYEDLCMKVASMYKDARSHPVGSLFVKYVRPKDCLTNISATRRSPDTSVHVVRYMITGTVRPNITRTINVGDFTKRVVMSIYGKRNNGEVSETFSGKNKNKERLIGHQHAFYLPTDEDGDNILDHITIIAEKAFDQKEIAALNIMNEIRYRHGWFDAVYQMRGGWDDFRQVSILQTAKKWESITPLVLNRHMKYRGKAGNKVLVDGPEDQIRSEIKRRFGDGHTIKNILIRNSTSKLRSGLMPIEFKRWRKNKLPGFGAYGVEIEFERKIRGPLALGHGSHFGLGLFAPYK